MTDRPWDRAPLVVIANSQEWQVRSLESILGPHGYAVLRAYNGKQALARVQSSRPDAIILDSYLPDASGLDVCRTLRADEQVSASTPILLTSTGPSSSQHRLDALRAGAWDLIGLPMEGEELVLRLSAYVSAKFDADRAREESLLDQITGLYNGHGLARRARELSSRAFREREPFACVVISPLTSGAEGDEERVLAAAVEKLARALREKGRLSDAIGRLGPTEFAVVAQGTNREGAIGLAERLRAAVADAEQDGVRLCAGFDAVENYHDAPIEPADMLSRAAMAMRRSRASAQGASWIQGFDSRAN